jgi:hypothetical protein
MLAAVASAVLSFPTPGLANFGIWSETNSETASLIDV